MMGPVGEGAAMRKARMIASGYLYVDGAVVLKGGVARSTAGPDAGEAAVVLEFEGARVRMRLTQDRQAEFRLVERGGELLILRGEELYASGVVYVPNLMHAPGMAFVNIESGCAMDCKFCATPHLRREARKRVKKEEWLERLLEAAGREDLKSIGITAGVSGIPGKTIADIEWLVRKLRAHLPQIPIGVEPYVESEGEILRMKEAGATELKLNLQTFDREVFSKVCPGWDFERQLHLIRYAAKIFGRERVTANLIVGMGESDESVLDGVRFCADQGIVPTIRALRISDINREHLEEALGGPVEPAAGERLVGLAVAARKILEAERLSPLHYQTMCHVCRACDLVPLVDV